MLQPTRLQPYCVGVEVKSEALVRGCPPLRLKAAHLDMQGPFAQWLHSNRAVLSLIMLGRGM